MEVMGKGVLEVEEVAVRCHINPLCNTSNKHSSGGAGQNCALCTPGFTGGTGGPPRQIIHFA